MRFVNKDEIDFAKLSGELADGCYARKDNPVMYITLT